MPTITIRDENGNVVEREIVSRSVVIAEFDSEAVEANQIEPGVVDDSLEVLLEPAVPQRIEYDDEGQMSTITTVCGETENRRETDEGIAYVLEGIITESQLTSAKNISRGDDLTIISDLHSGPIEVQRVTIEQNNDLFKFKENGDADGELAFAFQMQFQEPETGG